MIKLKKVFFSALVLSAFMTGSAMAKCEGTANGEKGDLPDAPQAEQKKDTVTSGAATDAAAKKAAPAPDSPPPPPAKP